MGKRKHEQSTEDVTTAKKVPKTVFHAEQDTIEVKDFALLADKTEPGVSAKNVNQNSVRQPSRKSASKRLEQLMTSLEDILDPSVLEELNETYTEKTASKLVKHCSRLQSVLRKERSGSSSQEETYSREPAKPATAGQPRALDVAEAINSTIITPWTPETITKKLPKLPDVLDPVLERAAFTHNGCVKGWERSYESLEWIGDAYIYLIAVLAISKTFPEYDPGQCSRIREVLVKNKTLSSYSRDYGFDKRAVLPPDLARDLWTTDKGVKIQGDIFEAYVAAVILSDPAHGLAKVVNWLKDLWSPKIAEPLRVYEKTTKKFKDAGAADGQMMNSKVLLSQRLVCPGVKLHYKDIAAMKKDKETGSPLYTVGVILEGWGEVNKQLGFGSATSKKEAGLKAASMALENKKLLKPYEEMKRMYLEKQAAATANVDGA